MISLLPLILLATVAAFGPAAAADHSAGRAHGERPQISGRIELFPDGRIVRLPGRAATPAPAPGPPDGGSHGRGPPAAPVPAGFAEPRFHGAWR